MNMKVIPVLMAVLLISGCATHQKTPNPMPPMTPPQAYTEPEQRYANPGSMYDAAEATDLYADNRARRVGDLLIIKIVEDAKSKSKADTSAARGTGSAIDIASAFGRGSVGLGGALSGATGATPLLSTKYSSSLTATGETKRENYVTSTMGARVVQVLPSGVLQLQGARKVRVNGETQYLIVSGLVRAQDVDSDNSVESTRLADSSVELYGDGVLADKQTSGWLTRLLDHIWPF